MADNTEIERVRDDITMDTLRLPRSMQVKLPGRASELLQQESLGDIQLGNRALEVIVKRFGLEYNLQRYVDRLDAHDRLTIEADEIEDAMPLVERVEELVAEINALKNDNRKIKKDLEKARARNAATVLAENAKPSR